MTPKETKILAGVIGAVVLIAGFIYAEKVRQRQANPQPQNQSQSMRGEKPT
ncbi:MAG: hypothetical protein HY398_02030 [Candidatus Doudnabacteria bacterium]|nr:hypothetical protein [Candidatus Doudnabacteria bacterium]